MICMRLQMGQLQEGSGCRPTYTLRTLGRALEYARLAVKTYGLQRALYDGAAMAFQTQLQPASMHVLQTLLCQHLLGASHLPKVGARSTALNYSHNLWLPALAQHRRAQ